MDFEDSPQEASYRARARDWIVANAIETDDLAPEERRYGNARHKAKARAWQARKAGGGFACITWPEDWGGPGGTAMEQAIFNQEEAAAGLSFTYYMTGLQMLLPAILQFSHDPTTRALVPAAVRGENIWCQLFSEPAAGSDSAGMRCAATRDGDFWVISGQKMWNSGAHYADYGMILTRTDPDVPKHKGMTMFWIDMHAPGVEVRQIRQMTGDAQLNEVFLTEVRIPDSQRVGGVGEGWKVTLATLMNERAAIGAGSGLSWRDALELARAIPSSAGTALDDPAFREHLADWYVEGEAMRLMNLQALTSLSRGVNPGPEGSAGKLIWSSMSQDLANHGVDLQDQYGLIDDPAYAEMGAAFQFRLLWSPGLRLGGGTDEILKNIIAERVLGLPGDIRVDKDVPFRSIPTGR